MSSMHPDILREIQQRLVAEFGFKDKGKWYQQGRCRHCGKKELYTAKNAPWTLHCGRANRCGKTDRIQDIYRDVFESWSSRFKPTADNPNASAEAYLLYKRRLDLKDMKGCFSQEVYKDFDRNITSATVRFPLPGGGHWERLIDQESRFEKKAHFKKGSSWSGHWWRSPRHTLDDLARAQDLWITEGIFDAWALNDPEPGAGLVAVSAMSVNVYPEKSLKELRMKCAELGVPGPRLVWAFDIGKAGTEYTKRWVEQSRKDGWQATAAQPRPEGEVDKQDWNDLKNLSRLRPDDIATYLWNGEVLLATNATAKAMLLWQRHKWSSFSFVHDSRTWWAHFDEAKIAEKATKEGVKEKIAARACANVTEIANCAFRILYFQEDQAIGESHYYLRIDTPTDAAPAKAPFTAGCLAAATEFKKRLLAVDPGAQWLGSTRQLDILVSQQRERGIKRIQTIDFTGYSRDHGAWVLGDIAVHRGKVIPISDEDFFDLGDMQVKLRSSERILSIDYDAEGFDLSWVSVVWRAFGNNGMVVVIFWIMAMFAEQIRREYKLLGFIEMSGLPGTGKSTLIEFLWKLFGRENYEGFDPAKATPAARARNLAKVANLPVVFMEGDRSEETPHSKKFDWDEIKPLFQGRVVASRGVKSGGNETYEPPFRGALIIEQNYPVKASAAVMERIMQMTFTKDGWSADTKEAAEQLKRWPIEQVSGTIIHIAKQEGAYLKRFKEAQPGWERAFLTGKHKVRNNRIRETFSQLHAGLDAVSPILKLTRDQVSEIHDHIGLLAVQRDRALESDNPVVAEFWERFEYLQSREPSGQSAEQLEKHPPVNLARNPTTIIAVNLAHFESACRAAGLQCPPLDQLRKHLPTSKARPFLEAKTVNTVIEKHLHCWVFSTEEAAAAAKQAKGKAA